MGPLVTRPESKGHRLKLIEKALKEQAPLLYSDLKKAGMLGDFIITREKELMNTYSVLVSDHGYAMGDEPDALPLIQMATRKVKHPWIRTLETLRFDNISLFPDREK